MSFAKIIDLFEAIQPIKRKYPMVFSYLKHLHKQSEDETQQTREIEKFKTFLLKNDRVLDRVMNDWYYDGTLKTSNICFENVIIIGNPMLIDAFWTKLADICATMFPDGIAAELQQIEQQKELAKLVAAETSVPVDDAINDLLASNPILSDYVDDIKRVVAQYTATNGANATDVFTSKEFQKLVQKIQSKMMRELQCGRIKFADITRTIQSLMKVVSDNNTPIDPALSPYVDTVTEMLTALDSGTGLNPELAAKLFEMFN